MSGLLHAHSGLRYIALALLVISIIIAFISWSGKKPFTEGNRKLYLFTMVAGHIQLLIGLILFVTSIIPMISNLGFGEVMKNPEARFFAVEHPAMMILSLVFLTVGHSMSKKTEAPANKHRFIFVFYLLALILIFFAIPWPFMSPARPLF
ncbi:MAG TPA: cytochrome B [Bacteroidia bacterium]